MTIFDLEGYRRKGYLELGRQLETRDCAKIQQHLDELDSSDEVPHGYEAQYDKDGNRRRLRKVRRLVWNAPELYGPILNRAGVTEIAEQIIGTEAVAVFHAAFLKPARIGTHVALHQDQALWSRTYPGAFSIWFALSRVSPRNGGLFGCPASHRNGEIAHMDDPDHLWHQALTHVQDELEPIRQFILEPGEAVMWDRYFAHGSSANKSPADRRGMVVTFADGSADRFEASDALTLGQIRVLGDV